MNNKQIVEAFALCNFYERSRGSLNIEPAPDLGGFFLLSYAKAIAVWTPATGFVLYPKAKISVTTSKHYTMLENELVHQQAFYNVSPYEEPRKCPTFNQNLNRSIM